MIEGIMNNHSFECENINMKIMFFRRKMQKIMKSNELNLTNCLLIESFINLSTVKQCHSPTSSDPSSAFSSSLF